MNAFLFFLLKSGICISAMFLFYQIALPNHSFFHANRLYLILLIVISFSIPLLVFTIPVNQSDQPLTAMGYEIILDAIENPNVNVSYSYYIGIFFLMLYIAGVLIIGTDTVVKYYKAFFIVKKAMLNMGSK